MELTATLAGLVLFLGIFLVAFLVLVRPSAESALLEKVTQQSRREEAAAAQSIPSFLSVDQLAKPFSFFRRLFSAEPDATLVRRLMLAGYRKSAHADLFLGARLALPAFLGFAVAFLVSENTLLFFILALVLGFFAPDFWLSHAVNARRDRIRFSLPDGLDLLAICMEAGLGLDQAIVRVGQELRLSHRELSEELLQINLEQRAGSPRITAWKDFADRANVESVRSFVAMLIQTDRFGTPISKSLSVFSDSLRTQRRQQAEEIAAKTTIKLVPPLVFFIFPAIFIVTVAPAVITVMRNMARLGQ
ncbi:MAG: type II secretion system F family protein [Acidobacteriia bacterium]|nr:type II secretion system F family protein [Terriglobia bacterium]